MSATKIYDPKKIEAKWLSQWADEGIYKTKDWGDLPAGRQERTYVLGMFPYPSGDGLHVGHVRIFTACDVLARYLRMNGKSVLLPMGWDAFGLPAENAAIKGKTNPMDMVPKNETNFKRQMQEVGLSYDWDKEFSTTDPDYYKWTQWLFLKLYSLKNEKGERLIYRKETAINWCPFCKTGLANEEVLADGTHERCGTIVEQRALPQWMMRITDYAERLLEDLKGLDWPRGIIEMQKNWIGKSEGVKIKFKVADSDKEIEVFTTRLDTINGVTFLVIAPERAEAWLGELSKEVTEYIESSLKKTEQVRLTDAKEKSGINTGIMAVNPSNGEKIPVWIADYVLASVGTGAVMGVPAEDERDGAFAKKYSLPFKEVGVDLSSKVKAEKHVSYHLRDWIFSRQRYWGEPFPLIYCDKCGDENGVVVVPDEQLPVKLPYMKSYEPSGTGESPLAAATDWVETTCPICGGKARRETDTMPNWAGSCWYFLRFADPKNSKKAWSKEAIEKWSPVDWYLGGAEHAVLHLLYARFWTKAFQDLGLLNFSEPFTRLRNVGMVLAEDGRKMSKSWGNVINPDDMITKFGADTLRLYEMFMGPWEQSIAWETRSMVGCYRFIEKVWSCFAKDTKGSENDVALKAKLNKLIEKVGKDIAALKFNTAVAAMMEFVNAWNAQLQIANDQLPMINGGSHSVGGLSIEDRKKFLQVLAPIAPFAAEELWHNLGETASIHISKWPTVEKEDLEQTMVDVAVQVGGKMRSLISLSFQDSSIREKVEAEARADEKVGKWLKGRERVIFVPGKVINFVIS